MKITDVRIRAIEWRGKTVPLPPHFCTNPMDILQPAAARAGGKARGGVHGDVYVPRVSLKSQS